MRVGVVCDLSYGRSIVISVYYHAVKALYPDVILVKTENDLDQVDMVFVGNDHFEPHKSVFMTDWFLKTCNRKNIKVIIIGAEKICGSPYHATALTIQKRLGQFQNLTQYVWDVDDAVLMGKKILGYSISRNYRGCVDSANKMDRCVFVGQCDAPEYTERRDGISQIQKVIAVDVISSSSPNAPRSWNDYLSILAKYKYVFSPLTWGNSLNFRFYESLLAGSIPIHQVRSYSMLEYFPVESRFTDCIFFERVDEIPLKLAACKHKRASSMVWLEDKIRETLTKDGIWVP